MALLKSFSIHALLCGLFLSVICAGVDIPTPKFWMDPECEKDGQADMTRTTLGRVHVRAHYAVQALDKLDSDVNVQKIVDDMLGDRSDVSTIKTYYTAMRDAAKRGIWTGTKDEFVGVSPKGRYTGVSKKTDIAFICNFSHLEPSKKNPARMIDTWKGGAMDKSEWEGPTVACMTRINTPRLPNKMETPQLFVWWPYFVEKYKPRKDWNLLSEELYGWALTNPPNAIAKAMTPTASDFVVDLAPFDIVTETPEHIMFHELLHARFAGETKHGQHDGYGWKPAMGTTMKKSEHTEVLALLAHVLEAYARIGIMASTGDLIDTRELHKQSGAISGYTMPEGMKEYPQYPGYRVEWHDEA